MSTFRRRLVVASSDSKYAIVKCYNDTFDLACLTDGIVEYQDTNGDTQYIAGSASGVLNIYTDSSVRITKASGIVQVAMSQAMQLIESKGINFTLNGSPSAATHISINLESAQFAANVSGGSWVCDNLILKNCPIQSFLSFNSSARSWVKNLELYDCSNLTTLKLHNYTLSGMNDKQNLLNNITLNNCALLNMFSVYGNTLTNSHNNLQTFTINDCPNLNKIYLNGYQYLGTNLDNSANFFAFLRILPTRSNADGEIGIGYMGPGHTADNIMIDGVTMRTYLENKGWTFLDNKPAWAESTTI